MSTNRIVGFVLVSVGIALLWFGINASHSMGERVYEDVMGRFTDRTTWFIIGGIASIIFGVGVAILGGRRTA